MFHRAYQSAQQSDDTSGKKAGQHCEAVGHSLCVDGQVLGPVVPVLLVLVNVRVLQVLDEVEREEVDAHDGDAYSHADLADKYTLLELFLLQGKLLNQLCSTGEVLRLANQFFILSHLEPDFEYDHNLNDPDAYFQDSCTQGQYNTKNVCFANNCISDEDAHSHADDRKDIEEREHVDSPLALLVKKVPDIEDEESEECTLHECT